MENMETPLRICLLSYRSNPHSGGQGVYLKNLSRALTDLGHSVEVISGPPGPDLDNGIPLVRLPSLDLYNPENLFRMPSVRELCDPINLIEWVSTSTMGFPEPLVEGNSFPLTLTFERAGSIGGRSLFSRPKERAPAT